MIVSSRSLVPHKIDANWGDRSPTSRLVDTKRLRAQSVHRMPRVPEGLRPLRLDFGSCQLRHDPVVGVREWRRVDCYKRQGDQEKLGVYCASKFLVTRVGPHDKGCTDLKRCLLIPKLVIFDSRVCRGMPSLVAAPNGPETRPPHSANAVSIISLS